MIHESYMLIYSLYINKILDISYQGRSFGDQTGVSRWQDFRSCALHHCLCTSHVCLYTLNIPSKAFDIEQGLILLKKLQKGRRTQWPKDWPTVILSLAWSRPLSQPVNCSHFQALRVAVVYRPPQLKTIAEVKAWSSVDTLDDFASAHLLKGLLVVSATESHVWRSSGRHQTGGIATWPSKTLSVLATKCIIN